MGAASSLRFRHVLMPYAAVWTSLAVLLLGLGLLAFVVILGAMSQDPSPASEQLLIGPFRWGPSPPPPRGA